MQIGGRDLGERAFLIAEIGNNHEGRWDVAERLVREAAACGVDAVKFQTFRTEHFVRRSDTQRFAQLAGYELTEEEFARLAELARSLGLVFLSTPLDLRSVEVLRDLVAAYKIASGDIDFQPLIERALGTGKPLVLSTGASDLAEVRTAVDFVRKTAARLGVPGELAVLHCVTSYPAPPEQVNLRAIALLARELDCPVGYSDHTVGIEAACLAVAVGAVILEKHFTLDHNFSGFRDHQLSADPAELKALVERIRAQETLLGVAEKRVQPAEAALRELVRRSVVAARDLPAGHRLETADLTWMRPAGGLPPGEERPLLGRSLRRPLAAGEPLDPQDLE